MANDKTIGVIQEQGFAAGTGLGFNPLTESDKTKVTEEDLKKNETKDK